MPREAARYCLEEAGLAAAKIDAVAFPYAPISIGSNARWHYAKRHWYAPDRALDAIFNGNRRFRRNRARVTALGEVLGVDWERTTFEPVEHHLAHASSAYHLSGFGGRTAVLGVDGKGEYATTFFGVGEGGAIRRIREFYDPDSLSGGLWCAHRVPWLRNARWRVQVDGDGPLRRPRQRFDFAPLLGCRDRGRSRRYAAGEYRGPPALPRREPRALFRSRPGKAARAAAARRRGGRTLHSPRRSHAACLRGCLPGAHRPLSGRCALGHPSSSLRGAGVRSTSS